MQNFKKYVAEFIGTFVLVLVACGVAVVLGCDTPAGYIGTALAFGLVIVAMAYSIGNVSGCHINPAVSLAMFINKKMTAKEFVGYVVAQVLGAIAGAAVLALFTGSFANLGGNAVQSATGVGTVGNMLGQFGEVGGYFVGLIAEIVLTFIFVIAILGVTSKQENSPVTGLVIGGALTLVHLLGIGITGTSVNPARSIGPALLQMIGGNFTAISQIWIFIVGPLAGAALAAVVYRYLTGKKEKKSEEEKKEEISE